MLITMWLERDCGIGGRPLGGAALGVPSHPSHDAGQSDDDGDNGGGGGGGGSGDHDGDEEEEGGGGGERGGGRRGLWRTFTCCC